MSPIYQAIGCLSLANDAFRARLRRLQSGLSIYSDVTEERSQERRWADEEKRETIQLPGSWEDGTNATEERIQEDIGWWREG